MEVGCGTGYVLSAIAASRKWERLCGSELHEQALTFARQRLNGTAELIQIDARAIPARYSDMDVIGAFDVIEHIEDDEAVLRGMHRALRPGGGLMITVPQHGWLWSSFDEVAHHVRRYDAGQLRAKIEIAGFHVLFSGSYTFALLPAMLLSRLFSVQSDDAIARAFSEVSTPKPINVLFRSILNAEVALTLAGVRFPVGGSRVVVARKI
jgi:2-polyprenyl-3-methyl-5-hydroxy-6-metoxy-1,4-benzoquinol methylase